MYQSRADPAAEGVRTSLEQAARMARLQDIPRIEALATMELRRRFGNTEQGRARLEQLLALHPGLREIEVDNHGGLNR
jgi:hypothetical protein